MAKRLMELAERIAFEAGLKDVSIFKYFVRPAAYFKAGGDPERVHELALEMLNKYSDVLETAARSFDVPELRVTVLGKTFLPFGTAGGLDKNGDALLPLSHLFGFLEPGTITLHEREGNPKPRVAVDARRENIYNAQGLPSKGLGYFKKNVERYFSRDGRKPLYFNICGIPDEKGNGGKAFYETEKLLETLLPFADGFVWNPFCPNDFSLATLRTPDAFRSYAQLFKQRAGSGLLKMVKIGPYGFGEIEKRMKTLELTDAWMEGGGDGVVAVNTRPVDRAEVPSRKWGYPTAGVSGKYLQEYRQRVISDMRHRYPKAVIFACGGIDSANEAYRMFAEGVDAVEGYTPYALNGFGALYDMVHGLKKRLNDDGYKTLKDFMQRRSVRYISDGQMRSE